MRLALVATDDSGGGFWATYRLLEALNIAGVDVRLFVINSKTGHIDVKSQTAFYVKFWHRLQRFFDGLPSRLYTRRSQQIFSNALVGSPSLHRQIKKFKPDIIHLHWITGGAYRLENLNEFDVPIVWSHHDMWAFTGGCHYTDQCTKYLLNCGACPSLGSSHDHDLSRRNFNRKHRVYSNLTNLTNIGLSHWMFEELNKSSVMKDKTNIVLPNPIDTSFFTPIPKDEAKKKLGLDETKTYLLFSAMNSTTDKRKGFAELHRALQVFPKTDDIELIVLGGNRNSQIDDLQFKTTYLGFVTNWKKIKNIYSAVDLMITPSLQENLSNAIMECMSCGTAVVAFDIGGNSDMIDHKRNGYLAKKNDHISLSAGIQWVLENEPVKLGANARRSVIEQFDYKLVSSRYLNLYKSLVT